MADEAPASEHLETAERIADARGEGRRKEAAIPLSIAVIGRYSGRLRELGDDRGVRCSGRSQ